MESTKGILAAKRVLGVALLLAVSGGVTRAAVARIEIHRRESFAGGHAFGDTGAYERITGRLHVEVDPFHPANRSVVDIELAPRTPEGNVAFQTDFFLLKPVDTVRGNRCLLYDVNNRGNKLALAAFNEARSNDPATLADAGNGFLMRRGYTLLWTGWNGDVLPGDGRLQIDLPVATDSGEPITGRIYSEICVNQASMSQPLCWGNSRVYPAVSVDNETATLSVRSRRSAPAEEIPRDKWSFGRWADGRVVPDPTSLYLADGFRPGWLYDLVYTGRDPRVSGLGFVAVRDAVSFFRHARQDHHEQTNPLSGAIERACIFGVSQSGRFICDFLYQDFNGDEAGRRVFDAAFIHVAAAGRMTLNSRFAQITRHGSQHEEHLYPFDSFPFATVRQSDPLTGEEGDWLERPRRSGRLPKIFMTHTSTEYWGRGASLLHTDVQGREDAGLDPNVRLYHIAGGHHLFFAAESAPHCRYPVNSLNYRPVLRALLVALDRWVSNNQEPPESAYPRIADGTLVDLETYRKVFPVIPGVQLPDSIYAPLRLDLGPRWKDQGIADHVPPKVGGAYRTLVPAVDADGNELAGIRVPDVAVPRTTHVGWNLRAPDCGAAQMMTRWEGASWPFLKDDAAREETRDPRRSFEDRYATQADYLDRKRQVARQLCSRGLLLEEDLKLYSE